MTGNPSALRTSVDITQGGNRFGNDPIPIRSIFPSLIPLVDNFGLGICGSLDDVTRSRRGKSDRFSGRQLPSSCIRVGYRSQAAIGSIKAKGGRVRDSKTEVTFDSIRFEMKRIERELRISDKFS